MIGLAAPEAAVKSGLTVAAAGFCSGLAIAAMTVSLLGGPAAAQDCSAAIAATKAEWQSLTQGNHRIAPSTVIATNDGRRLTGSQLNYVWTLIDRAGVTCADPEPVTAMAYLSEATALLHPILERH